MKTLQRLSIIFVFMLLGFRAMAQDFGQIVSGSLPDVNRYAGQYLKPFAEGEINNLSRGWSSTGKVHKPLGFDVTIVPQFAIIPSNKQNFVFKNADYSSFKLEGTSSQAELPTFMGGSTSQVIDVNKTVTVDGKQQEVSTSFTAPKGVGDQLKHDLSFLPVSAPLAVVQLGIGLPGSTDLKIRYFPKSASFDSASVGLFGLALQHEISRDIPFLKVVHALHVSLLAGYSQINADYHPDLNTSTGASSVSSSNSLLSYKVSVWTFEAVASLRLAFLELYTNMGYMTGKSNVDLKGSYNISYTASSGGYSSTVNDTQKDPVSLSYSQHNFFESFGARFNIAFFKLFAEYTLSRYQGIGAGISFSFR